jgi:hypothetical protein
MAAEALTAIIAGACALLGGALVQVFQLLKTNQDRRHERKRLLREKYEEVTAEIRETVSWAMSLSSIADIETLATSSSAASAQKVIDLCRIYFPELKPSAIQYSNALTQYHKFAIVCVSTHGSLLAGLAAASDGKKQTEALRSAREELYAAIEEYATNYTQA